MHKQNGGTIETITASIASQYPRVKYPPGWHELVAFSLVFSFKLTRPREKGCFLHLACLTLTPPPACFVGEGKGTIKKGYGYGYGYGYDHGMMLSCRRVTFTITSPVDLSTDQNTVQASDFRNHYILLLVF
jgi:hypothetical protein